MSIMRFFHHDLLYISYLIDTVKLPFIMGVNLHHLSDILYIFHLVFYHIIICIVKQMYINFSVCSLHTCEIKYLIMITIRTCHALIYKYNVSLFFITLSFPFT